MTGVLWVPAAIRRHFRTAAHTCAVPGCGNTCAPFNEAAPGVYACGPAHLGRLIRPALAKPPFGTERGAR